MISRQKNAQGVQAAPDMAMGVDGVLGCALALLVGLGVVMVYSSSAAYAARLFNDPEYFLKRQILWLGFGTIGLLVATKVPGDVLIRRSGWLLLAAVVVCVLVLFPALGVKVGGARRWLTLGVMRFQPSEVAKLGIVVFMATVLSRRMQQERDSTLSLLVPAAWAQIPIALVLVEPDLGTALVMELIVVVMIFVAGLRVRVLALFALAALPIVYHLVVGTPFRLRRILGFMDPWAYRSTIGYQITEALISIGSGGLGGLGLGQGKQSMFFLPEAHTDFIFAIVAEELGFIGVSCVLLVFTLLVCRGLQIAFETPHSFDAFLGIGLTAMVAIPVLFNTYVVTGLLPPKGLALPLLSSGGSNLVVTMVAIGMLSRIRQDGLALRRKA